MSSSDPTLPASADEALPAADAAGDRPEHPRTIRSYVMRAGRTTEGQARALSELGPRFVLPFAQQPLDLAATFGREAPVVFEIGFEGIALSSRHKAGIAVRFPRILRRRPPARMPGPRGATDDPDEPDEPGRPSPGRRRPARVTMVMCTCAPGRDRWPRLGLEASTHPEHKM